MLTRTLPKLACWAALLAGAGLAQAESIALRVQVQKTATGLEFSPVHAQRGDFGLTVARPEHSGESLWRVVAKDGAGRVLHETTVRNTLHRHVEVFNAKTGAIEESQDLEASSALFEVAMPFDAQVASIEVVPAGHSAGLTGAANAAFTRDALQKVATATAQALLREAAPAATATATTIIETGPAKERMDIVFVGDGYTAAEMTKWHSDAQSVINGFMADPLLAAHKAQINIRRVDIASNQSGVDEPDKGVYRDTAMDGAFNCANIARLLCVNTSKVFNIVGSVLAPEARDFVVVISNSTRYGGSGGEVAAMSMNSQSIEVALHEIGHTAFALADEYEYGTCDTSREPSEGDVSMNKTRSVKWGALINASTPVPTSAGQYPNGTVGVFQGARYCTSGMYRPTENSRMRALGYPWHAVNEGLAAKVFAKYGSTTGGDVTQTGSLAKVGAIAKAPSAAPNYVDAGAGTFTLSLTGPAGANFDLALFKQVGTAWKIVANSTGGSSTESIKYVGTAGKYYARVKATAGTGSYTLKYKFPPK